MLNSGKKFRALLDKKNKYSNSSVARKKNYERNKKPLQVKWSVPKYESFVSFPNKSMAQNDTIFIFT